MSEEATESTVKLRSKMATDVGVVRDHNEDAAHVDEQLRFFVVADGMGGHAAGEVASAMAVEGVRVALEKADTTIRLYGDEPSDEGRRAIYQILEGAVREAHRSVYDRGIAEPEKQGMGTTLDVVLVTGQEALVAHVGDSRTYLMRDGKASQLTTDHTVAEVLVIEGKLSPEDALVSPMRTILVNALGVAPEVGVEMAHLTLKKGDRLLLCSDGLHDYFTQESELFTQVIENEPEVALQNMIDLAKKRGGHDNITGVIVEVLDAPEVKEITTIPLPIARAASDGIPEAISRDDTVPVDVRADLEVAAQRGRTEPIEEDDDLRATVPLRMKDIQAGQHQNSIDDAFRQEATVEIDCDGPTLPGAESPVAANSSDLSSSDELDDDGDEPDGDEPDGDGDEPDGDGDEPDGDESDGDEPAKSE